MHITFLMQDAGSLYGAERATLDLVSGLVNAEKVRVSVVLINESRLRKSDGQLERAFREANVPCYSLSTQRPFSRKLIISIREYVNSHEVDCLHVVGYKAAVHGGLAVRNGRLLPWVSTVHGWLERPNAKERFYGWIEVQMLKRAQRIIVLSNYYHDRLAGLGIATNKMTKIPSGLRLDNLSLDCNSRTITLSNPEMTIGILGRLSSEKNHAMFLHVARNLLDHGYQGKFLIAGDGPERETIEKMVCELQLQAHVELAGVMDRTEFFRQCDLLTMCSRIENLPYTILEAMACLCPVVSTRVGGVPDLVEPGVTGLLVEDQDIVGMAAAILRLLPNPSVVEALIREGQKRLKQKFSLEQSVEAHLRMYRELTGS
ncbi:MAG: glycosyltransferase family 4 protein [Pirellulales bacterium]